MRVEGTSYHAGYHKDVLDLREGMLILHTNKCVNDSCVHVNVCVYVSVCVFVFVCVCINIYMCV